MASVRVIGEVVYVRRAVPQMRRIILEAMNIMVRSPPVVIFIKCHSNKISPEDMKKRFNMPVKIIIGTIGFTDLSIILRGMPESKNAKRRYITPTPRPKKPEATKSMTIYKTVSPSFTRGSRRWMTDLPGKYLPIVISLINLNVSFFFKKPHDKVLGIVNAEHFVRKLHSHRS